MNLPIFVLFIHNLRKCLRDMALELLESWGAGKRELNASSMPEGHLRPIGAVTLREYEHPLSATWTFSQVAGSLSTCYRGLCGISRSSREDGGSRCVREIGTKLQDVAGLAFQRFAERFQS
jgi:hypothetical protein